MGLERHAGAHPSCPLREVPGAGFTRSQPDGRHHRQSKRQEQRRGGASIDRHGYDAGKKIKGQKRHLLVDTEGLLLHAIVHAADLQDRDGGVLLMASLFGLFPFLRKLYADGGYQGPVFRKALARVLRHIDLEIVKRSDGAQASRCCPSAGSSSAPSAGSTAAGAWPRIGRTSTARPSPSSNSPPSASCCEHSVTPHDVPDKL